MELKGSQDLPLARQQVWESLNDPGVLKACIPGCEEVVRVSDDEYSVAMTAAVGPVKAKFKGRLLMSERVPPASYTLTFEGSGGPAGFGKGHARVVLEPAGEHTILRYQASAQVGGKLAQVGSRLVEGVAQKIAAAFFERFKEVAMQSSTEPEPKPSPQAAPVAIAKEPKQLRIPMIVVGVLVIAAVFLLGFRLLGS
jgi:uncharacterized protein